METLEQQRARDAWKRCSDYSEKHVKLAKSLPALIMNSGLMQVMAFLNEKDSEHQLVAKHLRSWLHRRYKTPDEFKAFMEHLMKADARTYQAVTTEAFAWLKWLRQMAAARHSGGA